MAQPQKVQKTVIRVGAITSPEWDTAIMEHIVAAEAAQFVPAISFGQLLARLQGTGLDAVVFGEDSPASVLEYLPRLREAAPGIQIVFVNVRDDARCAWLLKRGADDAVMIGSAAYGPRIRAAIRRTRAGATQQHAQLADIVLQRDTAMVWCAGKSVHVTNCEFLLLDCLLSSAPRLLSTAALAECVWGDGASNKARARVQVYVCHLRRKLKNSRHVEIESKRGVGYRLSVRAASPGVCL